MATFSRTLEHTLRRALQLANEHEHEYVTLEHLLMSLIDDDDAAGVMHACKVDLDKLRLNLDSYLRNELESLRVQNRDMANASGFIFLGGGADMKPANHQHVPASYARPPKECGQYRR